jgi:glycosyltransferase involved in cell wall biosynthesis
MNILVFNWRDITHPWAGGAELNIHEQAKRWVLAGHQVTLFCGDYEGCAQRANIDGVEIVRKGSRLSVYLWAPIYYCLYFRQKYDVIVDIENGIPFFTPLFSKTPKVCITHHVHTEQFQKEFSPFLARIGIFLESVMMPLVYRKIPFITISQCSREQLIHIGIKSDRCSVVYCGLDHNQYQPCQEKTSYPSLIYLGRLMNYKRVDLLIKMMPAILNVIPDAVLHLVGSGPTENYLKQLRCQLRLERNVIFHGHVNEGEKTYLLQHAWLFVIASMKEGWGLVAIEANACGIPVIAFNVPGLCEAIDNPHSGILVESEQEFVAWVANLIEDENLRKKMSRFALEHAKNFDWDVSAQQYLHILESTVRRN